MKRWKLKSVEYPMQDDRGTELMLDQWEPFGVTPNGRPGISIVWFRKQVEVQVQKKIGPVIVRDTPVYGTQGLEL